MSLYCSVDEAVAIMGSTQDGNALSAAARVKVLQNLRVVTKRINTLFRSAAPPFLPLFEPVLATVSLPIDGQHVDSGQNTFRLDRPLLALSGGVTLNGTVVSGVTAYPDSAFPPFQLLRLASASGSWYSASCDSSGAPLQGSIAGLWGYHSDYAHAWLQVDALAAAILTASATTFTVADVDGDDAYGQPVRISPGHLLKLEDEYVEVIATVSATNTVTVLRGVNGTTAAAHVISTPVWRWQVEPDVQRAAARQAGLLFSRLGAYVTVEVQGMSEVRYPADWLQEVMGTMQAFANG